MAAIVLSSEGRADLLVIARKSLEDHLLRQEPPSYEVRLKELLAPAAAFVTLTQRGELRGCIGLSEPLRPLHETVAHCAIAAATEDPRFAAVRGFELPEIRVSISVLSPLEPLSSPELIEIGRHGLMVRRGGRRGLLLPQVAIEQAWDRLTFLQHTARKAGLAPDDWEVAGSEVFFFEADVFSES
jgi:AmmeMemoRadiSam system protein A